MDDGIDNKLDPGEAEERNIYEAIDAGKDVKKLPMSLGEALEELRNDEVIRSSMVRVSSSSSKVSAPLKLSLMTLIVPVVRDGSLTKDSSPLTIRRWMMLVATYGPVMP